MKAADLLKYAPAGALAISIASLLVAHASYQNAEDSLIQTRRVSIRQLKSEIFYLNAKSAAALESTSTRAEGLLNRLKAAAAKRPYILKDPRNSELVQTLESMTKLSANQVSTSEVIEKKLELVGDSKEKELELIDLLAMVRKTNATAEGKAWDADLVEYERQISKL